MMIRKAWNGVNGVSRIFHKTVCTNSSIRFLSVQKSNDGFFHDPNPLSRKIFKKNWTSPASGRVIDFVRAEPRDVDVVSQFWLKGFHESNNMCHHLNLSFAELCAVLQPWVNEMISTGDIIVGFDKTKYACLQLMRYHYENEFEELFNGELPGCKNPVYVTKDDYAKDIESYPLSRKSAQLACILDDMVRQTGKFLPAGVKSYSVFEATYVHKAYQKDRIGYELTNLGIESTLKRNIHHGIGYCVATGTRKIAEALNWKVLFEAPYATYKDNGKPVFYDMIDGAKSSVTVYQKFK